jgi:hypothetical protein
MVECQKFNRKINFAPNKKCQSFSPKSCTGCTQSHIEPNDIIDQMIEKRKANMSIFRFPIQSSAEIHPHQFFE